ncbi:MAG: GNAT family N-acetyltransferase [Clostridium sp.]
MITRANRDNLNEIMEVLKETVNSMNTEGLYQWNESYPNKNILLNDIDKEELFIKADGNRVKGFVVLNQLDDKDYNKLNWKHDVKESLIVHRLCVAPKFQGNGVAKELMEFIFEYAKINKYEAIRLDTSVENTKSIGMYEKLGYVNVGIINMKKGDYVCFEKSIS